MKKFAIAFALVVTLVVALLYTGNVFAQGTTPPAPQTPGSGYGRGVGGGAMMGGRAMGNGGAMGNSRGMMGGIGAAGGAMNGEGILHDGMIAVYAEKLGISVADLNARLDKGETMAQIAASKGLTAEQFTALMKDARTQAIDQAVKAGTLTQAQADWMKTRGMMGAGQAGRGMRGNGTGNPATCPYFTQTNP